MVRVGVLGFGERVSYVRKVIIVFFVMYRVFLFLEVLSDIDVFSL